MWAAMQGKNAGFNCEPHEILALRKALGWSLQELGEYLGLYINPRDCYTVYRWEKGLAKPRRQFRLELSRLASQFREDYQNELKHLVV